MDDQDNFCDRKIEKERDDALLCIPKVFYESALLGNSKPR